MLFRSLFVVLEAAERDAVLQLPRFSGVVRKAGWMPDGAGELSVQPEPGYWSVKLSSVPAAGEKPVLVLELDEPVQLFDAERATTAQADGTVLLRARDAIVHGKNLRYEPQPHKNTVGYWSVAEDWAEWLLSTGGGEYSVEILQGCGRGHGGSRVQLQVQDQSLLEQQSLLHLGPNSLNKKAPGILPGAFFTSLKYPLVTPWIVD